MLLTRHALKTKGTSTVYHASRPAAVPMIATVILGSLAMVGLSSCGQKGDLYLVDPSSQTVQESTAVLDSSGRPQDEAFANLEQDRQRGQYSNRTTETSDFVLPTPSSDPNDY